MFWLGFAALLTCAVLAIHAANGVADGFAATYRRRKLDEWRREHK